jgi:hypothetical protein
VAVDRRTEEDWRARWDALQDLRLAEDAGELVEVCRDMPEIIEAIGRTDPVKPANQVQEGPHRAPRLLAAAHQTPDPTPGCLSNGSHRSGSGSS